MEDKIDDIDDKLSSLRSTYKSHSGTSTHYVLGEPQYLEKINKNIPYTGGVLSLDSKLSENIYNEVLKYANIKEAEEVKDSSFFSDLFDKTIMGYFKNDVAEKNQSALDIDIFKALEKEYSFDAQNVNSEDKLRYVSDAINDSVELANPFIENPIGEEKHPIFAASYSPELMKTYQNDEKHMELINKIYDLGGRENDLMSKYEIQFYKAIYAISAQDLSKFAPAKESETDTQSAGAYY
ncbi:MAG: hypothetical protein LBM13_00365 [Candidatus Ancillula sp.]|nr:hypothetical protein [Candidatus Ancillula sp.]